LALPNGDQSRNRAVRPSYAVPAAVPFHERSDRMIDFRTRQAHGREVLRRVLARDAEPQADDPARTMAPAWTI
jgi:hypothetical protein